MNNMTDNEKSQRVIEKCGFTFEGIKRKSLKTYDGKIHDVKLYSITKDENERRLLPWQDLT